MIWMLERALSFFGTRQKSYRRNCSSAGLHTSHREIWNALTGQAPDQMYLPPLRPHSDYKGTSFSKTSQSSSVDKWMQLARACPTFTVGQHYTNSVYLLCCGVCPTSCHTLLCTTAAVDEFLERNKTRENATSADFWL